MTSSRDRTVRFWSVDPANKYRVRESPKIMVGHTSFVGPLAWISPNDEFPEGGIVSGGMDTLVMVWDVKSGERVHVLRGHQMQVTGIALDDRDIITSSVDWYIISMLLFLNVVLIMFILAILIVLSLCNVVSI